MRTICCVVVWLATGAACSAQYTELAAARRDEVPKIKRFRFLSLAEARAHALEQGYEPQIHRPGSGLDFLIESSPPAPKTPDALRVLSRHPSETGSIVLVARIPQNVPRAEVQRNLNQKLLNVENAYWNLYGSYWQLHSREQALRHALETWTIVGANYRDGKAGLADFAQAQGQYELFRSQRLQAFDTVLDNERQLRAIAGMQIEDGTRLVPCDVPSLVETQPDWDKAVVETMKNRPELHMARADVQFAEFQVAMNKIHEWFLCSAEEREVYEANESRLEATLGRVHQVLEDQEHKAARFLGLYYRRMASSQAQIKAARAQREAFATQMRIRSVLYRTGKKDASLDVLLEAQRFWSDALATECQAIVTYNNSICGWAYAKGSILSHARVTLSEDAPLDGVKVRAVVVEGKRTRSKVRQAKAVNAESPLNVSGAVSLPALWKRYPPLLDAEASPTIQLTSTDKTEGPCVRLIEWKVADIFRHMP